MTKPLSPSAQAVLDAASDSLDCRGYISDQAVAALRAASVYCTRESTLVLMNLAAELEAQP